MDRDGHPFCRWKITFYEFGELCLVEKISFYFFFFFFKILFVYSWERERSRDIGRGRSRLPVGSPIWDLIPGPWDHDLSWRQMLNHWATGCPSLICLIASSCNWTSLRLVCVRQHFLMEDRIASGWSSTRCISAWCILQLKPCPLALTFNKLLPSFSLQDDV